MNTDKIEINNLECCLTALGAEKPFNLNGELTNDGYNAYNRLRQVLHFMEQSGVIEHFREDKLDEIVNTDY